MAIRIKEGWRKLNGEFVKDALKNKGMTMAMMSRMLGMGDGWVSSVIYEGRAIKPSEYTYIASLLEEPIDKVTIPPIEEVKETSQPITEAPISDEQMVHLLAELAEIKAVVKRLDESFNPRMLTDKERAIILLKQMLGDSNRCEFIDYTKKCNELGIDNHTREQAMECVGCTSYTQGYGINAHKVITRKLI